jgi:sporulation protein YlmC with PRC-barrel domain
MYKTIKALIALSSVLSFVLLGGSSAFAQDYNESSTAIMGATYQPTGWNTFEASWLIGHRVKTKTGADLGQINSLVIDEANGRVALVVLSDVPGLGHERLAIPYRSITNIGQDMCDFNAGDMEIGVPLGPGYVNEDPYVYAVTRYPSYSAFYGLPSVIDAAWLTDIYRHYGQVPYWTERGSQLPKASELYESGRLIGAGVQLRDGEAAGQITDLIIDSSDGRIPLLLVDNVPGRETSLVAVPFAGLSARGENVFVLNTSRQQLALAPSFSASADLNNPRWAADVYTYFGLQPYWTEREEMAPIPAKPKSMEPERNSLEWYQMYGY